MAAIPAGHGAPPASRSVTGRRGPAPRPWWAPGDPAPGCFLRPRATAVIPALQVGIQWKQSLSNLKRGWTEPSRNRGLSEGSAREHLFTQVSQEKTQLAPLGFTPA